MRVENNAYKEQVYKGMNKMTKFYDANEIRNKLATNDKWLVRGILAIYARQTADERQSDVTKYNNGVGFNGRDAGILSSFAKQIKVWNATERPRFPAPLSPKQMAAARRMMAKYAGQLARIAEENNAPENDSYESPEEAEIRMENEAEARAERAAIQGAEGFRGMDEDEATEMEIDTARELAW